MTLKFIGNSLRNTVQHASAYFFTDDNELVIIDCSVSTFKKVKLINLMDYNRIYILITHTHIDHIRGLGLLIRHAFFKYKRHITIVAPSQAVADDIALILDCEGYNSTCFNLITVENITEKKWFCNCILTKYNLKLDGKCFGYHLIVDNINVVYTGDTFTLEPFFPYLTEGTILYVDTSIHYALIHLKLEDALEDFIELTKKGVKIYLMHLDDIPAAEQIIANYPDINIIY